MRILRSSRRRAVSNIIAGIIVFALLFVSGTGFYLFQTTLNHQNDQAVRAAQQANIGRTIESLTLLPQPVLTATDLQLSVVNSGGNATTLVALFVQDQTGKMLLFCTSRGSSDPTLCTTGPSAIGWGPVIPPSMTLGIGQTALIDTGIPKNSASLSQCSQSGSPPTPCSMGVITKLGRVLTTQYPLPPTAPPPESCVGTNVCLNSLTSQGFGFITFNFNFLEAYDASCPGTGTSPANPFTNRGGFEPCTLSQPGGAAFPNPFPGSSSVYSGYQVSSAQTGSNWLLFAVQIADTDPSLNPIVLNPSLDSSPRATGSYMIQITSPIVARGGGTSLAFGFELGSICGINSPAPCTIGANTYTYGQTMPPAQITLPPLTCSTSGSPPVETCTPNYEYVFFYAATSQGAGIPTGTSCCVGNVVANFLFLTGSLQPLAGTPCPTSACPYGQNLPFFTTEYTA